MVKMFFQTPFVKAALIPEVGWSKTCSTQHKHFNTGIVAYALTEDVERNV